MQKSSVKSQLGATAKKDLWHTLWAHWYYVLGVVISVFVFLGGALRIYVLYHEMKDATEKFDDHEGRLSQIESTVNAVSELRDRLIGDTWEFINEAPISKAGPRFRPFSLSDLEKRAASLERLATLESDLRIVKIINEVLAKATGSTEAEKLAVLNGLAISDADGVLAQCGRILKAKLMTPLSPERANLADVVVAQELASQTIAASPGSAAAWNTYALNTIYGGILEWSSSDPDLVSDDSYLTRLKNDLLKFYRVMENDKSAMGAHRCYNNIAFLRAYNVLLTARNPFPDSERTLDCTKLADAFQCRNFCELIALCENDVMKLETVSGTRYVVSHETIGEVYVALSVMIRDQLKKDSSGTLFGSDEDIASEIASKAEAFEKKALDCFLRALKYQGLFADENRRRDYCREARRCLSEDPIWKELSGDAKAAIKEEIGRLEQ